LQESGIAGRDFAETRHTMSRKVRAILTGIN
jgi:hypothetical protein